MATNPHSEAAQHFIPKFYLKGFTDQKGVLWVYEKFKPPRASLPKKEAQGIDYYTHAEDGHRDNSAEEVLQEIESRAAPIFRKLANSQYRPSAEQMGHLYYFVAFMFARVPSWLAHLDGMFADVHKKKQIEFASDRERFYKHCAEMERERGKPFGTDYEEMRQNVLSGKFNIEQTSKAFNLGSMFKSAQTAADLLSQYSYEVLYAPAGTSFVTSDSPVYTLQHLDRDGTAVLGVGFGLPRAKSMGIFSSEQACVSGTEKTVDSTCDEGNCRWTRGRDQSLLDG